MKLNIIAEIQDGHYWGRIEGFGFMPTGQGETLQAMKQNVKDSIQDYIEHEGKNDPDFKSLDLKTLEFDTTFSHYNSIM